MNLLPWQEPIAARGLETFQQRQLLVNAMPTGTGKTYITSWMLQKLGGRPFIICPKSVIRAWELVLKGFSVTPEAVVNWEKLRNRDTKWWKDSERRWLLDPANPVVVDEVHQGCSGVNTLSGWMLAMMKGKYPLILQSATIADNPLKMRSIGYLMDLHSFRIGDFYNWCLRNGCFRNHFLNDRIMFDYGPRGRTAMAALHSQLAPFMIRESLENIPGFPENQVSVELHELDDKYERELTEIYGEMEHSGHPLVEQLRNHQRAELCKVCLLKDLVVEELEEGNSVVVFVNFLHTIELLREKLRPTEVVVISGKEDNRDEAIRRFQDNEVHVCIATIQAGGVGISLHDEKQVRRRVSIINPSFSAVSVTQALGRIHRAGGTKVIQRFILAANTLEERVYNRVQAKMQNINLLNDGDLTILEG